VEQRIALKGTVDRDIAALFVEQLAGLAREDAPLNIDLEECDIEDASIAAVLVYHIRQCAHRIGTVILFRPPQVLAHGLYRIGALGPRAVIQVVEPREELGTAS
jgi:ABC-type transporter Mla MlaB component